MQHLDSLLALFTDSAADTPILESALEMIASIMGANQIALWQVIESNSLELIASHPRVESNNPTKYTVRSSDALSLVLENQAPTQQAIPMVIPSPAQALFRLPAYGRWIGIPTFYQGTINAILDIYTDQSSEIVLSNELRLAISQLGLFIETLPSQTKELNIQDVNQSVIESIEQGIVVLDRAGKIVRFNEFMRRRYGWQNAVLRKPLFEVAPSLQEFLEHDLESVLEEGIPRERFDQKTAINGDDTVVSNFSIYPRIESDDILGAILLIDDVTERAALEESIEARANQLAALTDVAIRISASLEREEVVELALDEMGWIIPFDAMAVWRRNGSFMILEGISAGSGSNILGDGMRIRIQDHQSIQSLVETQRVVGVSGSDVPHIGIGQKIDVQSWMGVPLVNQGHVVGMMTLERDEAHAYDSRQEHNVVFAFASQVAIALANADLFQQTFERTNELGTLLEAARTTSLTRDIQEVYNAVADLMFGALEMEDATIMIRHEIDNELEVQYSGNRSGDGTTLPIGTLYSISYYPARAEAMRDREVMVIIDVDDEERRPPYPRELEEMRRASVGARMFVPLVVRDEAIGLIQLDQTSNDEENITQQKMRLARALGSQVAVAIENARLTQETTARFEELLTINQLSQAISSSLELDGILPIVREQVPQVTKAEELYIALYDSETEMIHFPVAVYGDGGEFEIESRKLGNDEVSYIIKKKHALSLDDDYFSIDELRKSMGVINGEGDIKSYMGVPLKSGDMILGVLAIRNKKRKRAFDINDDRILTTVGSQLGAAIQNANLFQQIQQSAANLEELVRQRTQELETMLENQLAIAERSASILEGLEDGIIFVDVSGEIRLFNSQAERLLGTAREQMIGANLAYLIDHSDAAVKTWAVPILKWTDAHFTDQTDMPMHSEIMMTEQALVLSGTLVYMGSQYLGSVTVIRPRS